MTHALLLPTAEDTRSNATFDALMWALARPGVIQPLPDACLLLLAESLLDRECTFFSSDDGLGRQIAATGAYPAMLDEAEYVFTSLADGRNVAALSTLLAGNLLYPDASATIFSPAMIDGAGGTRLRLSGPGVNGSIDLVIGDVDRSFWSLRAEAIRYPLGWDVYLLDCDRLVGIPRSTFIEVL
ncbi:phosphonate C-P lyase system protein PhnH [Rhizobium terrae]|uniref:phosphonate C-P lyase system protein PhnH n=1 Tax=Rhizobium terrae TaxID=2171756 RepID=UPI000E3D5E38|nr:phosphonate C-P lyase system protein PhnH [Rhizobium terrae]